MEIKDRYNFWRKNYPILRKNYRQLLLNAYEQYYDFLRRLAEFLGGKK